MSNNTFRLGETLFRLCETLFRLTETKNDNHIRHISHIALYRKCTMTSTYAIVITVDGFPPQVVLTITARSPLDAYQYILDHWCDDELSSVASSIPWITISALTAQGLPGVLDLYHIHLVKVGAAATVTWSKLGKRSPATQKKCDDELAAEEEFYRHPTPVTYASRLADIPHYSPHEPEFIRNNKAKKLCKRNDVYMWFCEPGKVRIFTQLADDSWQYVADRLTGRRDERTHRTI